jgi:hypothetical protein
MDEQQEFGQPVDLPAMTAIVEALSAVPDIEPRDDVFEITAMTVLDALRRLPVEQRMEAMGMHSIALDTSGPLRGGLTLRGKLGDPSGFGTVHFKEPAVVAWFPNPEVPM